MVQCSSTETVINDADAFVWYFGTDDFKRFVDTAMISWVWLAAMGKSFPGVSDHDDHVALTLRIVFVIARLSKRAKMRNE